MNYSTVNYSIEVKLRNEEQWSRLHKMTNEMKLCKIGRRFQPPIFFFVSGLLPDEKYIMVVRMMQSNFRRLKYSDGKWVEGSKCQVLEDSDLSYTKLNVIQSGSEWSRIGIDFTSIKLTNDDEIAKDNRDEHLIFLESGLRYIPVLEIHGVVDESSFVPTNKTIVFSFASPVSEFIAVTKFKNPQLSLLKQIASNRKKPRAPNKKKEQEIQISTSETDDIAVGVQNAVEPEASKLPNSTLPAPEEAADLSIDSQIEENLHRCRPSLLVAEEITNNTSVLDYLYYSGQRDVLLTEKVAADGCSTFEHEPSRDTIGSTVESTSKQLTVSEQKSMEPRCSAESKEAGAARAPAPQPSALIQLLQDKSTVPEILYVRRGLYRMPVRPPSPKKPRRIRSTTLGVTREYKPRPYCPRIKDDLYEQNRYCAIQEEMGLRQTKIQPTQVAQNENYNLYQTTNYDRNHVHIDYNQDQTTNYVNRPYCNPSHQHYRYQTYGQPQVANHINFDNPLLDHQRESDNRSEQQQGYQSLYPSGKLPSIESIMQNREVSTSNNRPSFLDKDFFSIVEDIEDLEMYPKEHELYKENQEIEEVSVIQDSGSVSSWDLLSDSFL